MTVEDAVAEHAKMAAAILAERGKLHGFYGKVETTYQDDRIVLLKVEETLKVR